MHEVLTFIVPSIPAGPLPLKRLPLHNGAVSWLNLLSLFGWIALASIAWLVGGCRRPLPWRTVRGAALLMLALGVIVFLVQQTRPLLVGLNDLVIAVLEAGNAGALYFFGPLALDPGQATAGATIATLMTGALAGMLFHGQRGLLGL